MASVFKTRGIRLDQQIVPISRMAARGVVRFFFEREGGQGNKDSLMRPPKQTDGGPGLISDCMAGWEKEGRAE